MSSMLPVNLLILSIPAFIVICWLPTMQVANRRIAVGVALACGFLKTLVMEIEFNYNFLKPLFNEILTFLPPMLINPIIGVFHIAITAFLLWMAAKLLGNRFEIGRFFNIVIAAMLISVIEIGLMQIILRF